MNVHSKFKSVACISLLLCYRAGDTTGVGGGWLPPPPLFCLAKRRKRKQGEKIKKFKTETTTHVTHYCHPCQNVTVLTILDRLEF